MSEGRPTFRLRTLGELALYGGDEEEPRVRGAKALALVAFLALTPDHRARRPYLARLFWPGADRTQRLRSLRQALYYVTDRAGRDLFRRGDGVLGLREDLLEVDLWALDEAMEAGDYGRVVELHRGGFLEGFEGDVSREFHHWREAETERVWSALKLAYRHLVDRELAAGETGAAVEHARSYRELNPLDESARRLLVEALVADGREARAYQEYQQYAALLEEQLGDAPSEEFESRIRQVREVLLEDRAGGGPDAPSPGGAPGGGPGAGTGWGTWLSATAVILALAALVWVAWGESAAAGPFASLSADVHVVRETGREQWTIQLRRGTMTGLSPTSLGKRAVRRPGRPGQAAAHVPTESGLDLGLVGDPPGDTTMLTSRPHDEHPHAWSPDGRWLLHDVGVLSADGRRYFLYPAVLDPSSGRRWSLATDSLENVRSGDWSPYGPRVAIAAGPLGGPLDVWIVPVGGGPPRNVTRDAFPDAGPVWSPEAGWIAYSSPRGGDRDVFLVRPDGTERRQVSRHPADDRHPVWLGRGHLGFLSDRGGGTDLWVVHLPTGERRRVTRLGDLLQVVEAGLREPGRWIDSVVIRPRRSRAVAGEYLRFRASAFDVRGRRHEEAAAIGWHVSDSTRLVPAGRDGLYRVAPGAGPVAVRAELNGWRADSLALRPARLARTEAEVHLSEGWEGRPFAADWYRFGAPSPTLAERADVPGPFARAMDPEGDRHYTSGAVATEPVPLRGGATVSVWIRAPFDGGLHQNARISLAADSPAESSRSWRAGSLPVDVKLRRDGETLSMAAGSGEAVLPLPVDAASWRRYTVQVGPEGAVWLLVDGRLLWRSPERLDLEALPEAHLVLHGRSVGIPVHFGPVRLHEGPRYRLAEEPSR